MKKLLLLLLVIFIIFGISYLLTPKQKRLSDDYEVDNGIEEQQDDIIVKQDIVSVRDEDINIYYFAKDDSDCSGELIATTFSDLDKRYTFQEINAVVTLLQHQVPENLKSAFILGTTLNQLTIRQGVASVDLSRFLTLGGDKACSTQARIKQLKATLSQFPDIQEIKFLVDGEEI